MTDLTQRWWQHGEGGVKPPNGLDKEGGNQYEAEYYDYLADGQYKETKEKNEAIQRRVTHLHGNRVLDGLNLTNGENSRDVEVSASSGAYVNGQFTGAINAQTLTLPVNDTGSSRTDSIYVQSNGSVSTKIGTSVVPPTTYKLGESVMNTNNVVISVLDTGLQRTHSGASSFRPPSSSTHLGDTLYNEGGSPSSRDSEDTFEVWDGDKWEPLVFADGRQERTDHQYYGGNNIYDVGNLFFDEDGDVSLDDRFLRLDASNDPITGSLEFDDVPISGLESIEFSEISADSTDDIRANINYHGSSQRFEIYDVDADTVPFVIDDTIELNKTTVTDAPFVAGPESGTNTSRILQWKNPVSQYTPYFEYTDDTLALPREQGDVFMMAIDMENEEIDTRASTLYEQGDRVATRTWTGNNYIEKGDTGRVTATGFVLQDSTTQLQETFIDLQNDAGGDPASPPFDTLRLTYNGDAGTLEMKRGSGDTKTIAQF